MLRGLVVWMILLTAWTRWTALSAAEAGPSPEAPSPSGASSLAKNVLTVIPPAPQNAETFGGPISQVDSAQPYRDAMSIEPIVLVELAKGPPPLPDWTPHFSPKSETLSEMAQRVMLRREVWCFEFAFKPLRTIYVDVPQPSGKMQRKLIWYMVYRVRYLGRDMKPLPEQDQFGNSLFSGTEAISYPSRRFLPQFVLESPELGGEQYLDRVIPAAKGPIREREMRHENRDLELYDTVEITRQPIPLSNDDTVPGVWGLVSWEDVDPRIDYFSVFVTGLTNAYVFESAGDSYQPGDPPGTGSSVTFKSLQLNFWRPGDKRDEKEQEARFGVPVDNDPQMQQQILDTYGIPRRLDYLWVYRYKIKFGLPQE